jgi:transposase
VQLLYLLKRGQAPTRQDGARLLGLHRHTIGDWLVRYIAGGLDALLALYAPAGKRPSLSPKVLASLEQVLQRPEGLASYEALRQWLRRTHGVEVKYKTLYSLVRTRFDTKLKMPCLSQTKKACSHTCIPGELSGTPRSTQPVRQSSSPPSVQPR